jgi:hypothetical protein
MSGELQPNQVRLGGADPGRVYDLVPQRIGRIGRKLPQVLEMFAAATGQAPAPVDVSTRMYEALKVFIPDLAPFWELAGYPSEAAFKKREEWEALVAEERKKQITKWWGKLDDEAKVRIGGEAKKKPAADADFLPLEAFVGFEPPKFEDPRDEADAVDKSPRPNEVMDAIEVIFAIHGGTRLVRLLKNFMSPEAIRGMIERTIKRMQIESALRRSQSLLAANGASAPTLSTTPSPTPQAADGLVSLLDD